MKRSPDSDSNDDNSPADTKKPKLTPDPTTEFHLDENLLYEILKHVDAKTLATSACVNKTWCKTASDERLWEMICTQQWACGNSNHQQLRSVVLALGGFRRLHSLYIWPLSKPSTTKTKTTSSSESAASTSVEAGTTSSPGKWKLKNQQGKGRLGKDEVHLSLSLLSIRYYEKMNLGFGMMKR